MSFGGKKTMIRLDRTGDQIASEKKVEGETPFISENSSIILNKEGKCPFFSGNCSSSAKVSDSCQPLTLLSALSAPVQIV